MVDSCGYYYSQVENITTECVSALGAQETISSSSICHSTISGLRKILRVQEILARQCWKRLSEYWQISWNWFILQCSHGLHQFYDAFSSQYATSLTENILVLCVILEWLFFRGKLDPGGIYRVVLLNMCIWIIKGPICTHVSENFVLVWLLLCIWFWFLDSLCRQLRCSCPSNPPVSANWELGLSGCTIRLDCESILK